MTSRRSSLFSYAALVVLGLVVLAGAWYLYDRYGNSSLSPEEAIPANTVAFIQLNQPGELIGNLHEKNDIWKDLLKTGSAGAFLEKLILADSLMRQEGMHEFLDEGNAWLCLSDDTASVGISLIFTWPYATSSSILEEIFMRIEGKELRAEERIFKGLEATVLSDSNSVICYYSLSHGLCMIASDAAVMKAMADRIENKSPLPHFEQLEKVAATSGRNVNANIYINFNRIPGLARRVFFPSAFPERRIMPAFGSWSEIDLIIKSDELLMNGYTETLDSLDHFLGLFERQQAQKIEITRILPYNTSMLLSYGLSDFSSFYVENTAFMHVNEVFPRRDAILKDLRARYGKNLEKYMTEWVGNEIALAMINPHMQDIPTNTFLAIHARDIEMAVRNLRELSSSASAASYRDYRIRRISGEGLIPVIYGRVFSGITGNYYTRIEDYIVFANSQKSLENFINIFLSGKTLEQNENFKGFVDNVSDRSNLFCYFNIRNTAPYLDEYLSEPLSDFIRNNSGVIKNFEAFAVQFKALNNMFFSSLYLRHNPSFIKEDLSIWKAYLDAPVYGRPYFVKDHRTNYLKIIAFDTLNNMYLIDHDGNIAWKLNIGEKVMGDVHTVDYYRNGKIQYLFNTENHIYLIDLLGRDVEGYPVELKGKATSGLAVFDYDNRRDYRILLAMDDNRIYNYDIQGKKVEGWKNPLSKGKVSKPVQHLREGGKDYVIIADEEGNVSITDRRGRSRINLKSAFSNALRSDFYVNETNSKGIILTTGEDGQLSYISARGKLQFTKFGEFSRDHYFLYEDFDNKRGKDFIFLDGNKLQVFDRFKNLMFSWEFENEIHSSPVIIPVSAREKLIGVVSETSGKIYLFDRSGTLLSTPDHVGKTQILVGSLKRDGQLNMIVGSGNTIYNYYFR